jgi:hypothetical protein
MLTFQARDLFDDKARYFSMYTCIQIDLTDRITELGIEKTN